MQRMKPAGNDRRSIVLFFTIAFLIPIIATLSITLIEGRPALIALRKLSFAAVLAIGAMVLSPAVAAIVAVYSDEGRSGIKALFRPPLKAGVPLRWYALSLFLFPVTILITLLFLSLVSPELRPAFALTLLPLAGLLSTFSEEVGWTGFAAPAMLARSGPLKVGLVLGALEALWHLPADLWGSGAFHGSDFAMHFAFTSITIVAFRIVVVWIYVNTGSLLLCWLAHAGFKCGQLQFVPHTISSQGTIIWQIGFMVAMAIIVVLVLTRTKGLSGSCR